MITSCITTLIIFGLFGLIFASNNSSCFTANLYDTFGDGWGNAELQVKMADNNFTLHELSLPCGQRMIANMVCVESDGQYLILMTSLDKVIEITNDWEIFWTVEIQNDLTLTKEVYYGDYQSKLLLSYYNNSWSLVESSDLDSSHTIITGPALCSSTTELNAKNCVNKAAANKGTKTDKNSKSKEKDNRSKKNNNFEALKSVSSSKSKGNKKEKANKDNKNNGNLSYRITPSTTTSSSQLLRSDRGDSDSNADNSETGSTSDGSDASSDKVDSTNKKGKKGGKGRRFLAGPGGGAGAGAGAGAGKQKGDKQGVVRSGVHKDVHDSLKADLKAGKSSRTSSSTPASTTPLQMVFSASSDQIYSHDNTTTSTSTSSFFSSPAFYISDETKTKLLASGSMADEAYSETCSLCFPDGSYYLRVTGEGAGEDTEQKVVAWSFCGVNGTTGTTQEQQQLSFRVTEGICIPQALHTVSTICNYDNYYTILSLSLSLVLQGVTSEELNDYDREILTTTLSSLVSGWDDENVVQLTTSVHSGALRGGVTSTSTSTSTERTRALTSFAYEVQLEVSLIPEDMYDVDGTNFGAVSDLVSALYNEIDFILASGQFTTSLAQDAEQAGVFVFSDLTGAFLSSLTIDGIQYVGSEIGLSDLVYNGYDNYYENDDFTSLDSMGGYAYYMSPPSQSYVAFVAVLLFSLAITVTLLIFTNTARISRSIRRESHRGGGGGEVYGTLITESMHSGFEMSSHQLELDLLDVENHSQHATLRSSDGDSGSSLGKSASTSIPPTVSVTSTSLSSELNDASCESIHYQCTVAEVISTSFPASPLPATTSTNQPVSVPVSDSSGDSGYSAPHEASAASVDEAMEDVAPPNIETIDYHCVSTLNNNDKNDTHITSISSNNNNSSNHRSTNEEVLVAPESGGHYEAEAVSERWETETVVPVPLEVIPVPLEVVPVPLEVVPVPREVVPVVPESIHDNTTTTTSIGKNNTSSDIYNDSASSMDLSHLLSPPPSTTTPPSPGLLGPPGSLGGTGTGTTEDWQAPLPPLVDASVAQSIDNWSSVGSTGNASSADSEAEAGLAAGNTGGPVINASVDNSTNTFHDRLGEYSNGNNNSNDSTNNVQREGRSGGNNIDLMSAYVAATSSTPTATATTSGFMDLSFDLMEDSHS